MKGSRSIPRTVVGGFLAGLVLMARPLFAMDNTRHLFCQTSLRMVLFIRW